MKTNNSKQKKQNKNLTKPTEEYKNKNLNIKTYNTLTMSMLIQ